MYKSNQLYLKMLIKDVHLLKIECLIVVTEEWMLTSLSEENLSKTLSWIVFTESEIVICERDLHFINAWFSISLTELGNIISFNFQHCLNIESIFRPQ